MTVKYGLLATLEAKPGRANDLADFLKAGRDIAVAEIATVTWYAFQISENVFGVFDTFDDEAGRQAHLEGQIPVALGQVGPDLLARDPIIQPIDVVAVK
jgi:quinol monooxygenase YgiN